MRIGFTGTRDGMTFPQAQALWRYLGQVDSADGRIQFHHGDCLGADADAHSIALHYDFSIIGHPPVESSGRAFCEFDEVRPAQPFLKRNHEIVDETEILLVAPKTKEEQLRSGTWATYRYAVKQRRRIVLFYPNGEVEEIG